MILEWKNLPNGKEKYQAYLASREWAVLKEAIRSRSAGTCEHCRRAPGTQTHHQTYARKYAERLEDLLHVCEPCHLFLSGKTTHDPSKVLDDFVTIGHQVVRNVYLAGKITGTHWREEIAPGWSHENHSPFYPDAIEVSGVTNDLWQIVPEVIPVPGQAVLAMTGPFWMPLSFGGHATSDGNMQTHGQVEYLEHGQTNGLSPGEIRDKVEDAIRNTDLLFAWIDSTDCYGTIAEIAYASRIVGTVVVSCPPDFDLRELWLAFSFADYFVEADSPGKAWGRFFAFPEQRRRFYSDDIFVRQPDVLKSLESYLANEEPSESDALVPDRAGPRAEPPVRGQPRPPGRHGRRVNPFS